MSEEQGSLPPIALPEAWRTVPVLPTDEMVDAARGLCMFFNGMGGQRWTLGQHADSGGYGEGYAHLLTAEERSTSHFPKAHQADLIWRAMLHAAPHQQASKGGSELKSGILKGAEG